jgi:serine/threonine-protein kinase
MALSPEGDMIVFVARDSNGTAQLYLRRLGQMLQATPLLGTEGASAPFFSPDGQSIGFFVGSNAPGRLKKIAIKGGAPVDLASAPDTGGGAWAEDGTIVFASRRSNAGSRLMRVPQDGGTVEPVGSPVEGEVVQSWPQILPGGKAVLYTGSKYAGDYDNASLMVQPLPSGTPTPVLRDGYHGRYLSSGHLVYIHDGKLYAVAFDLGALKVTGRAVPVVDAVASNAITGGSQFSVSASGMLVYLTGPSTGGRIPVEWMDRTGKSTPLVAPENWFNIRLAPGGNRLAVEIRKGQADIFVYDLAGTAPRNLTALPNQDKSPVWTPTGGGIVYASDHENQQTLVQNLWWRRADGTGDPNRLTSSPNFQRPGSWHPTGAYLAFEETTPATATTVDVMILPLTGDDVAGWKPGAPPFAFANSKYPEAMPAFSRDGNWLAYCSNEQGQVEVYVQPFRGRELHPELRIKIGKGSWPTWSGTNKLFFGTTDGQIMVARYTVKGGAFLAEPPELWSEARYQTRGLLNRMFDLDPNEERFALARAPTSVGAPLDKVTVVWNFFEELRRLAPETRR